MTYFLYYAGFEKATGLEQIGLATSSDLVNWKRVSNEPIIPVGSAGAYDKGQASNPCVLKHDGIFKMWYQGRDASGAASVCYAESGDGKTWSVAEGAQLKPAHGGYRVGYHQPHVLWDAKQNMFRMWVTKHDGKNSAVCHLESTDGKAWSNEELVISPDGGWEGVQLYYPFVRQQGDMYEMWYTGRSEGHTWTIGRATSSDGIKWKKDTAPVLPRARASGLVRRLADMFETLGFSFLPAAYGCASAFVFEDGTKSYMLTHDAGGKKRLSMSLYLKVGDNWQPIKNHLLRDSAQMWDSYFQADPFLLIQ